MSKVDGIIGLLFTGIRDMRINFLDRKKIKNYFWTVNNQGYLYIKKSYNISYKKKERRVKLKFIKSVQ